MKTESRVSGFIMLLIFTPVVLGVSQHDDKPTNPDALVLKEFNDRVTKYVKLHKSTARDVPALKRTTDPAQISAREEALASAIRQARPQAKAGDIFFPEARELILRIIRRESKGPEGARVRAAIKEGNPKSEGSPVRLGANAIYPDGAPLSLVPPGLLLKLPQLPKEVDYRFVGRHLILRDATANIIADYILDAVSAT
jgi:hypothetical protein